VLPNSTAGQIPYLGRPCTLLSSTSPGSIVWTVQYTLANTNIDSAIVKAFFTARVMATRSNLWYKQEPVKRSGIVHAAALCACIGVTGELPRQWSLWKSRQHSPLLHLAHLKHQTISQFTFFLCPPDQDCNESLSATDTMCHAEPHTTLRPALTQYDHPKISSVQSAPVVPTHED
jgi:hypothetical protein